jgi:drug/metabolite transporter (DMT)-like permease
MVQAGAAMAMIGGAVTASAFMTGYPRVGAQAVRYVAAGLVLAGVEVRRRRERIVRPTGRQWWWLIGAATAGLSVYNLAVVRALDSAEPTVVATVVSAVPLVLAVGAPLVARRRVPLALVGAAATLVAGAALVHGGGRSDPAGIGFAVLALAGESGFTLLSIPVLGDLGAFAVATRTTWIAAVELAVLAVVTDGRDSLPVPAIPVVVALAYLVTATASAFVLWFRAVDRIGGDVAGLTGGLIPVAAVATGLPLGVVTVDPRTVAGLALVTGGLVAGVWASRGRTGARRSHRSSVGPGVLGGPGHGSGAAVVEVGSGRSDPAGPVGVVVGPGPRRHGEALAAPAAPGDAAPLGPLRPGRVGGRRGRGAG